jgi:peptidyl-tRNA hydrolase
VVRQDLAPGMQLAQSCHACFAFAREHSSETIQWMDVSNFICILNIENEAALQELIMAAQEQGIKHSIFREDDLDNQITVIALEAGEKSKKLCSKLKLALKT